MNNGIRKTATYTRQGVTLWFLLLSLLLLPSCGVYSKAPPVNPEEASGWSGPLLEDADMENVRIYIKPNQRTITLNMENLDGDLRILLAEYKASKSEVVQDSQDMVVEELSVKVPQSGNYVLVIEKTNR
ncbi:MAG: hypothetical protein JEY71_17125 [Sphaerochaeta sp.]|nr:hypothetical protein [Sphaerochaeta sp.]